MRRSPLMLLALPALLNLAWTPVQEHARLTSQVAEADLIFQGVVIRIDYASSSGPGPDPVPHTFVTYRINHRLKGASEEGNRVTLRFLGGRIGTSDRYLVLDSLPTIDVGDEDLVFVKGNQMRECPLVGCRRGRFRVINRRVFTEGGYEVRRTRDDDIALGAYIPLEQVETWSVGPANFRLGSDRTRVPPSAPPGLLDQFDDVLFRNTIRQIVASAPPASLTAVVSARADQPFDYEQTAEAPPRTAHTPDPQPGTATERRERDLLDRGGGNPVIGRGATPPAGSAPAPPVVNP